MNIMKSSRRSGCPLFPALDGRCNLRQEDFSGDIFMEICGVA